MSLTGQKSRQKLPRPIRDRKHRKFIASLPCLACGKPGPSQCTHIRINWYRSGERPGDNRTVPQCATTPERFGCHDIQHSMNEEFCWSARGIDPLRIAAALYAISGDEEKGRLIILGARTGGKVS